MRLLAVVALVVLVGCSNNKDKSPKKTPEPQQVQSLAIDCETGFTQVASEELTSIITDSLDRETKTVELKSASTHGYDNSAYNLYEGCFSRKNPNCTVTDQMYFNHGGDPKSLSITGHFIPLNQESQSKYDEIDFDTLDQLNLKTKDGVPVTKDSIFGNPSTARSLALGESQIYRELANGTSFLALLDDTWANDEYALFKIKVNEISPNDKISISYERIAEAPKGKYKDFFCSKKARIEGAKAESGTAIIYDRSYGGYNSSGFGFDFGVNGFDGQFVKSERVLSFSSVRSCSQGGSGNCIQPYVGWVVGYWGGIVESSSSLEDVTKDSWPDLQEIDPNSASEGMELGKTYLISQLNDTSYTFGAIRITEIDTNGNWVKFDWRRVAIEQPYRFIQYTSVPIQPNVATGQTNLGNQWWDETHFDVTFGKRLDQLTTSTEYAFFDTTNNSLYVDNRYFPSHSGIIDVTRDFPSLNAVSPGAEQRYVGQFKRSAEIKIGHVYLISVETLWFKSVMAIQVIGNQPNTSTQFRYRRLYSGQTIPGQWYKN